MKQSLMEELYIRLPEGQDTINFEDSSGKLSLNEGDYPPYKGIPEPPLDIPLDFNEEES